MKQIITASNYNIIIANKITTDILAFIETNNYSKVFFLVDENSKEHCFPKLFNDKELTPLKEKYLFHLIEIPAGEEYKNLETCSKIWSELTKYQADRKSLLINLGGGVITDMGGFTASTFKRGIDFINIPTTLLSQVDASVGGKVGIDFNNFKNQIGLFNNPKEVYINPDFLETLDKRQFLSGFAETIKHALIYDFEYWKYLQSIDIFNKKNWFKLITRSIEIKNEVVLKDPFEKNIRKTLNFGHTIGHAIETFYLHDKERFLLHGEAIAIGMICEAFLSYKVANLPFLELQSLFKFINRTFDRFNLDLDKIPDFIALMYQDKKNQDQQINFALLTGLGKSEINFTASEEHIIKAFHFYLSKKPYRGYRIKRCEVCRLPLLNCICQYTKKVETEANFWIIAYDGELDKPTNTGHLITDSLVNAQFFDWSRVTPNEAFLALLNNDNFQPYVVFPADSEEYVPRVKEYTPIEGKKPAFIILDGTWDQARKVYRKSPYLADLPLLSLNTGKTSEYKLRRSDNSEHLCTAEVAVEILKITGDLEGAEHLYFYYKKFVSSYVNGRNNKAGSEEYQ